MTVRCKTVVANLQAEQGSNTFLAKLNMVYSQDQSSENYQFHASSPSGSITLRSWSEIANPVEAFVPGSYWYIETTKVDQLGTDDVFAYCYLKGVTMTESCAKIEDGQIIYKSGQNKKVQLQGNFNGMMFEMEVYIANKHVFDQFDQIGTLYKLQIKKTTKQGESA